MRKSYPVLDPEGQSFMIARILNRGILVPEAEAVSVPIAKVGLVDGIFSAVSGLFYVEKIRVPFECKQQRSFLPYGKEGLIFLLPVRMLGDHRFRFCPAQLAIATKEFVGEPTITRYGEAGIKVFTERPVKGFKENEMRNALVRVQGSAELLEAVVEDFLSYT